MINCQTGGTGRHERIFQQSRVGVNSGPALLFGLPDHLSPDRVAFDVAMDRHPVTLRIDQTGLEPLLPERAAAAVASIERLHTALTSVAHGAGQSWWL